MSDTNSPSGRPVTEEEAEQAFDIVFQFERALAARGNAQEIMLDHLLYAIVSRMDGPQRRELFADVQDSADQALQSAAKASAEVPAEALIIANLTHASVGLILDRLARRLSPNEAPTRGH